MQRLSPPTPSRLREVDARLKVLLGLATLLGLALTPSGRWGALGGYAVLLLLIWRWGAPNLPLLRALVWFSPLVLAVLPWLWLTPGDAWLSLGGSNWHLVITREGVMRSAGLILRLVLSGTVAVLLVHTTPWTALLGALRNLGVPQPLVTTAGLALRYLSNLGEMAQALLRARTARSTELPGRRAGGSLAWRARTTGGMAGNLILRALDRSERIYGAMLARGFDGRLRSLPAPALGWPARLAGFGLGLLILLLGQILP
ncbi:hypothetical protein SE15_00085 [Thermanaerothrix daxensis]|uniref:Cobalt ABC transporter permease n=1 Tax=Thermanaerothrix daxensis TaxID=869279 RepID=A0A0P6XWG6_9CHLR|nr:cobalt ECF transporter T component CbiQ [Thermanaerothrix daxensis]KPL83716.1 hypothetical protein SE15_00085 [Thermanaerothrix daxensis]